MSYPHVYSDEHQLWLQQLAEEPITIVQPYTGYKVHGVRFHTRIRSANTKYHTHAVFWLKGPEKGITVGLTTTEY